MKLYRVLFSKHNKKSYFVSDEDLKINDYVIIETDKGLQYGKVLNILDDESFKKNSEQYNKIIRKATEEDTNRYYELLKESKEAYEKCREFVKILNLDMNVIDADFNFDRSQLLFTFTADERVDFRELARKLAGVYHTRIELRQIGTRDKAKEIGGVGVCGQKLCCARFLNKMEAISMNLAKDQNLALNPAKINGVCGRLLCCLQYEDENYLECMVGMPAVGDNYVTKNGEGKVISIDILKRSFKVLVGSNKEEIVLPKIEDDNK